MVVPDLVALSVSSRGAVGPSDFGVGARVDNTYVSNAVDDPVRTDVVNFGIGP